MARKKVNLQFITNTVSRRATYKRRCQGLMKKASELASLCGAKACVLVYGEGKAQPEVWPSYEEARRLLTKYRDMPELGRFKKAENQMDFLGDRVSKLRGMVDRSEIENNRREALDILNEKVVNGGRPDLFETSTKVLNSLQKVVTKRKRQAIERLRELGAGPPLEPCRVQQLLPLPGSYSQPVQDPNTQAQQVPPNGGVLGTLSSGAFFPGSSSGCAGPSTSGGDMMMQPYYSPGSYSEFPWTWEWNTFPLME